MSCSAETDPIVVLEAENGDRAAFTKDNIVDAQTGDDASLIYFRLDSAGTRELARITSDHLEESLVLTICGHEITRPTVREPIHGGALQVAGASAEDAASLANMLKTGSCP